MVLFGVSWSRNSVPWGVVLRPRDVGQLFMSCRRLDKVSVSIDTPCERVFQCPVERSVNVSDY